MSKEKRNGIGGALRSVHSFLTGRTRGSREGTSETAEKTDTCNGVGGENCDALPLEGVGNASGTVKDAPETDGGAVNDHGTPNDGNDLFSVGGAQVAEDGESEAVDGEDIDVPRSGNASFSERGSELSDLLENYPELDVEALVSDSGFVRYCRRYSGDLRELYEGYTRLIDALDTLGGDSDSTEKRKDTAFARHMMSSTAFSKSSASPDADAGFELTPLQREVARRAGLSYREYSAMLRDVPGPDRIKKSSIR